MKTVMQSIATIRLWRTGIIVRSGSAWIGVHWSSHNKRFCINFIPFVTWWIVLPGGNTP